MQDNNNNNNRVLPGKLALLPQLAVERIFNGFADEYNDVLRWREVCREASAAAAVPETDLTMELPALCMSLDSDYPGRVGELWNGGVDARIFQRMLNKRIGPILERHFGDLCVTALAKSLLHRRAMWHTGPHSIMRLVSRRGTAGSPTAAMLLLVGWQAFLKLAAVPDGTRLRSVIIEVVEKGTRSALLVRALLACLAQLPCASRLEVLDIRRMHTDDIDRALSGGLIAQAQFAPSLRELAINGVGDDFTPSSSIMAYIPAQLEAFAALGHLQLGLIADPAMGHALGRRLLAGWPHANVLHVQVILDGRTARSVLKAIADASDAADSAAGSRGSGKQQKIRLHVQVSYFRSLEGLPRDAYVPLASYAAELRRLPQLAGLSLYTDGLDAEYTSSAQDLGALLTLDRERCPHLTSFYIDELNAKDFEGPSAADFFAAAAAAFDDGGQQPQCALKELSLGTYPHILPPLAASVIACMNARLPGLRRKVACRVDVQLADPSCTHAALAGAFEFVSEASTVTIVGDRGPDQPHGTVVTVEAVLAMLPPIQWLKLVGVDMGAAAYRLLLEGRREGCTVSLDRCTVRF